MSEREDGGRLIDAIAPNAAERARRGRRLQRVLDLDLHRLRRDKRFGLALSALGVLTAAIVVAPVMWVLIYGFAPAPGTVLMMERAAEGEVIQHQPVPIDEISPYMIRAVIAAEDSGFCTHQGFDLEAIRTAMEANAKAKERGRARLRGGSTISQQTAKNLFLWPARSWVRKGLETYFTFLIETLWSKRRIMEHYLNAIEFGDGVFGVEAAAQARFGRSAADLTQLQAARLAAVLPSPNRWRADDPGPYVRRRSAQILQRARVVRRDALSDCVEEVAPR
ncbi:MAG: monofunctional biosynthetic peptidoglycan transglycosylase [Hyphomonadaceae bacterium]|nr:monofunctional biosynthetic peptidoglycan transglycosylase [Hyphomonadaceae bacterium]